MAAKTTFTITHPDGTVSTRTTAHNYGWAVVASPADPTVFAKALHVSITAQQTEIAKIEAALASMDIGIVDRGLDLNPAISHKVALRGYPNVHSWSDAKGRVTRFDGTVLSARKALEADATEAIAQCHRHIAHLETKIAAGPQGELAEYRVYRWSSKQNLAQKAADKEFAYVASQYGCTVTVVPVAQ